MRKIQLDGKKVKQLRDGRDHAATQKEFAHEIRVSERRLRTIENDNALVTADVAERIARALKQPLPALIVRDDGPPSPPVGRALTAIEMMKPGSEQLLPRFDETIAQYVGDEAGLIELVKGNWVLVSHVLTALNTETSTYAEELVTILRSLVWDPRVEARPSSDGVRDIALRRRVRELLVLLKGNDIWVYGDSNMKALPESYEVRPAGERCEYEFQAIIAFGPPGEYGETSIRVPIDRGQPSILKW
ncbi:MULTISPECIES: helix-turn-helix transcriptional regulator [unclassified Bradyrhizobium]|uniref:helix-turn-helix transcriptional regulator n=1 Tax=unclassified Bradyrhizobium TaxID=2631580 RepID=UPI0028EF144F|nr:MULTISPECIES: helix-turn-helix transcriptional regulator [unclassified Bradyrhizobium]